MALDSRAHEPEMLRSHWETMNKTCRLSDAFDLDQGAGSGLAKKDDTVRLSESVLHQALTWPARFVHAGISRA